MIFDEDNEYLDEKGIEYAGRRRSGTNDDRLNGHRTVLRPRILDGRSQLCYSIPINEAHVLAGRSVLCGFGRSAFIAVEMAT